MHYCKETYFQGLTFQGFHRYLQYLKDIYPQNHMIDDWLKYICVENVQECNSYMSHCVIFLLCECMKTILMTTYTMAIYITKLISSCHI